MARSNSNIGSISHEMLIEPKNSDKTSKNIKIILEIDKYIKEFSTDTKNPKYRKIPKSFSMKSMNENRKKNILGIPNNLVTEYLHLKQQKTKIIKEIKDLSNNENIKNSPNLESSHDFNQRIKTIPVTLIDKNKELKQRNNKLRKMLYDLQLQNKNQENSLLLNIMCKKDKIENLCTQTMEIMKNFLNMLQKNEMNIDFTEQNNTERIISRNFGIINHDLTNHNNQKSKNTIGQNSDKKKNFLIDSEEAGIYDKYKNNESIEINPGFIQQKNNKMNNFYKGMKSHRDIKNVTTKKIVENIIRKRKENSASFNGNLNGIKNKSNISSYYKK